MIISDNATEFQHPEPGTVNAVCTRVIDLGTQESKMGKKKRTVLIAWEIAQLMEDQRPFLVLARFPANTSPQSLLGAILEQWKGAPLNEAELKGYDLGRLLGKPCLLTIMREGNYTNVKTAVKLPKGMAPLEVHGPFTHLDLNRFDQGVYDSLSEGLKATIAKSPEYQKAVGQGEAPEDAGVPTEDIPF